MNIHLSGSAEEVGYQVMFRFENSVPLLSQEGWREAPGWFQRDNPAVFGLGTSPRGMRFAIPLPS